MNEVRNILFDLDGTLVDSSAAIRASLAHALEHIGSRYPDSLPVEGLIGKPLLEIFDGQFGITGDTAERAIEAYRAHYDGEAHLASRVYEDVAETLAALRESGLRLFVATVKPAPIADKVLRDMGLANYFEGVSGSSMDHARRDKADIIGHALRTWDLDAAASVMIGDRAQDIEGARRNGMRSIAVRYGFGTAAELAAARPDHTVDSSRQIAGLLARRPT